MVSVREDNYLHELDILSLSLTNKYNMNANGDDHVSFTVLDLRQSPDGLFLLAATDMHRVILFRAFSSTQIRNFYGAANGSYSNPRVAWSHTQKYIYVSSEDEFDIFAFEVATQRVVGRLKGHTKKVVCSLSLSSSSL